ncbi:hypothetical protein [Phyllobacterium sp. OV277]|uniref:hypothetical protein n=1 Tax=Phyllobacterium sp. OV277 TaxID=1882772 RepID=UPI000882F26F|nr:hypothetical protein [Phyllobacterium sp. OV277]SDN85201.1 hypothetical protein SAMN05443582_101314 [Phyllobacterium sp. OV277]
MKVGKAFAGLVLISSGLVVSGCSTPTVPGKVTEGSSIRSVKTSAGKSVGLTNVVGQNPDCSISRAPKVKVSSAPSHGTVRFSNVSGLMPKGPGPTPNKCHSRRIIAVAATYTPAPGFVGTDTVTLSSNFAGYDQYYEYYSFNITVTK